MQVFYHRVAAAVNKFYDIALRVAEIVVGICGGSAVLVDDRDKISGGVIGEPLLDRGAAASRDHVHEHGAVVVVFRIGSVYYLAQTEAVLVVGIGVGMRPICDRGQLLAFTLTVVELPALETQTIVILVGSINMIIPRQFTNPFVVAQKNN